VTLRGKVIEVGGVKEKILAAYRSGLREVVLPAANEKDLRELPDEVRTQVRFSFVHTMDEAIEKLLLPAAPLGFADDLPLFEEGRLTVEGGRKTADGGRWTVDGGTSKEPPAAPDAPR